MFTCNYCQDSKFAMEPRVGSSWHAGARVTVYANQPEGCEPNNPSPTVPARIAVASLDQALEVCRDHIGTCVVLSLAEQDTIASELADVRELKTYAPFIVTAERATVRLAVQTMKSGAFSFLEAPVRDVQLMDEVTRALQENRKFFERRRRLADLTACLGKLTADESEVLRFVLDAKPIKSVERWLNISRRTYDRRMSSVKKKVGVTTTPELFACVREFQLLHNDPSLPSGGDRIAP